MAKENSNKIKLLRIYEILRQETDESNPISRQALCERLKKEEITCDPRTLSKDIKVLNEFGYEVMSERKNRECMYYVADRSFEVPELKILIDAVQAASFITEKKTEELVEKIAALGGSNEAEILKRNTVEFNTAKHQNEAIFYTVDALVEAILANEKVEFLYFDLDENKRRVYRNNGVFYVLDPVGLIFFEDNYYLLVYSDKHQSTGAYRLDRMDRVRTTGEKISEEAKESRKNISELTKSAFKMYSGETEQITLTFERKLLNMIYDKFGEETEVQRIGEDLLSTTVDIQVSPTFFGWLFQFGGKMRISAPEKVEKMYEEKVREALREIKEK